MTSGLARDGGARCCQGRSRAVRLGAALVAIYLGYGLLMFSLQRWIVFPRHATRPHPETARTVPGLERLWIEVREAGGRVEAWLVPGDGVSEARPGPLVVFAHGNAELIEDWPGALAPYRRLGVSVLLAEYRGYGRSAGKPSQQAITDDLVRFFDLVAARAEVDRRRIVFHGRSLGGGAACALAERRAPRALVLQSTFTSIRQLARRYLLPGALVRDPFDNLAVLGRYEGPVLVVHGRRDELIPYAHGAELARAARAGRLLTDERGGHNDTPTDEAWYWREVERFLVDAGVIARRSD